MILLDKFSSGEIITILVIITIAIVEFVRACKGEKNFILELTDRVLDIIKYFISETGGRPPQKINLALGVCVFLACIVTFFSMTYSKHHGDNIPDWQKVIFWLSLLSFFPILHFCAKFTRHRYK